MENIFLTFIVLEIYVLNGEMILTIRYADDIVLIAESEQELQTMLNAILNIISEYGLKINIKNTKSKVVLRYHPPPTRLCLTLTSQ